MNEPHCDPPTFEQALARLETIVQELEEGQLGLAESLARYEEGVGLLKTCQSMLSSAERRIELLAGVDAAGNPALAPFDDEATFERNQRSGSTGRRSAAAGRPSEEPSQTARAEEPRQGRPHAKSASSPQTAAQRQQTRGAATRGDEPGNASGVDEPPGLF